MPKFFTHVASMYKQLAKMDELRAQGYSWDKSLSGMYCAVVLRRRSHEKIWIFGLDGSISETKH